METKIFGYFKKATGIVLAATGIGFLSKKVFKINLTNDPTTDVLNTVKWIGVVTGAIPVIDYLIEQKIIPT